MIYRVWELKVYMVSQPQKLRLYPKYFIKIVRGNHALERQNVTKEHANKIFDDVESYKRQKVA